MSRFPFVVASLALVLSSCSGGESGSSASHRGRDAMSTSGSPRQSAGSVLPAPLRGRDASFRPAETPMSKAMAELATAKERDSFIRTRNCLMRRGQTDVLATREALAVARSHADGGRICADS